jgi:16S rRNA A1518/A1519 N6-dimethyltransferase RsmA/KsgA/DIM1 with predicted DNA glycosylase/AP lyase activity
MKEASKKSKKIVQNFVPDRQVVNKVIKSTNLNEQRLNSAEAVIDISLYK